MLTTLQAKAATLEYLNQDEIALFTYQNADEVIDALRIRNLSNTTSKYFWVAKAKKLYEKAIALAIQLEQKELAYHFCQKSHAIVLWEMLQNIEAKSLGNIPDSLVETERQLKIKIAAEELKSLENPSSFDQQALFTDKDALYQLQKELEQNYPLYQQIKYELPITNLKAIQKELESDAILVEYFIGEKDIYTFVISPTNFKIYSQKKPADLLDNLTEVRQLSSKYDDSPTTFDTYNEIAYELYETLLKDVLEDFPAKELVIIPDEQLGYLNFGSLLSHPNTTTRRYEKLPYIIYQHDFSYNYSSALFVKLNTAKQKPSYLNPMVGFAPVFSGNPNNTIRQGERLDSLIHNLPEVEYIQRVVGGIIYKDTTATLNNFKNSNQLYRIGHLATHATCDDINPANSSIHFSDTSLYCNEIYNLDLNYELVVLSACQTGSGKLQQGEGIISLARAFIGAGCPNVVTSLWNVNDPCTADLMKLFYENISIQQPKHEALANAQRTYLKQVDASYAHPYYWAAFIPIGNIKPISVDGFDWHWWGIGAVGLLLIFLIWRYK